jgi:hypothetical protein
LLVAVVALSLVLVVALVVLFIWHQHLQLVQQ